MANNEYGFDFSYFETKLRRVLRSVDRYTPDEFARECLRMAVAAESGVLAEREFSRHITAADVPPEVRREIEATALERASLTRLRGISVYCNGWNQAMDRIAEDAKQLRGDK